MGVMQTERLTELAKSVDPSRLVSGASGWHDKPVGDIIDMHIYLGPGQPSSSFPDSDTYDVVGAPTEDKTNAMLCMDILIGRGGGEGNSQQKFIGPFQVVMLLIV